MNSLKCNMMNTGTSIRLIEDVMTNKRYQWVPQAHYFYPCTIVRCKVMIFGGVCLVGSPQGWVEGASPVQVLSGEGWVPNVLVQSLQVLSRSCFGKGEGDEYPSQYPKCPTIKTFKATFYSSTIN